MSDAFVLRPRRLPPKRRQRKLPLEVPDVPGAGDPGVPGVGETSIVLAVLDLLAVHPLVAMAWRNNRGGVTFKRKDGSTRYIPYGGPEGAPDIIGFLKDGRFLAIEVKADGEQLTPEQAGFLERADECQCVAMVVRQPQQVMQYLKSRMHRAPKLLAGANGAPCYMRGPTCTGGGERNDVCWRHANDSVYGKGMGKKGHDLFGFFGCQNCENWYAGADLSRDEREQVFLPAWRLSMIYACDNGLL